LGLSLIAINEIGDRLMSGSTAYIAGEGRWTKAQKEAALSLVKYATTEELEFYVEYLNHLEVIEGDRMARTELNAPRPNYELVRNSFLRGGNQPHQITHLIWFYENAGRLQPFRKAVDYWIEGDVVVGFLSQTGDELYQLISENQLTDSERDSYINRIYRLDRMLSAVESNFSDALGDASFWINTRVYWVNFFAIIIAFLIAGTYSVVLVRSLFKTNEKLDRAKEKYKNVLSHSRDVIYQLDIKTGKYKYMSPSIKSLIGYDAAFVKREGVPFILSIAHPDDVERMRTDVVRPGDKNVDAKVAHDTQYRLRTKNGRYIWVNNKRSILKDENGRPVAIIGNLRDITERKKYVEALDASLKEKEMLLAEIHHRVKNNLSIVSSLVELQKTDPNAGTEESFNEIQSRIKSIALVHEKLYENETFADVDLADYLNDLLKMIHFTFESGHRDITINKHLDSLNVNIKRAVPIGLICNEMINNCYKYAFEGRDKGLINVTLNVNGQKAKLTVADDGVGLPKKFEEMREDSLGMTLIEVLTKQVEGELTYETNDGASFTVTFDIDNGKAKEKTPE
jgi:PAS domain S-box-containing protein